MPPPLGKCMVSDVVIIDSSGVKLAAVAAPVVVL